MPPNRNSLLQLSNKSRINFLWHRGSQDFPALSAQHTASPNSAPRHTLSTGFRTTHFSSICISSKEKRHLQSQGPDMTDLGTGIHPLSEKETELSLSLELTKTIAGSGTQFSSVGKTLMICPFLAGCHPSRSRKDPA